MLTSAHAIIDFERGRAVPDRLERGRHRRYVDHAERMLEVYRHGVGTMRRDLHRQVEAIFADEPDCPVRRVQSFIKLLDDKSTYPSDPRGDAARLRTRLFTAAAEFHPLVEEPDGLFEHGEAAVKSRLADGLGTTWPSIERKLYADVMAFQRLQSFEGYPDAGALLSRYNVAQLQACLYRAEGMTIEAAEDFKTILRYAKLARLLHEITPAGPSRYRVRLSGPASVLRETRRYGVNLARFLPALLACRGWRMTAAIRTPWRTTATLRLSDRDGFRSHFPSPAEFDSSVEEAFARKFGPHRDGWRLIREGKILRRGQTVFVPDFVFHHDEGTSVPMEIVGFWTPEYLAAKRQTLRTFGDDRILLAIPERSMRPEATVGERVIVYKTALKIAPVLAALERIRCGRSDPSVAER